MPRSPETKITVLEHQMKEIKSEVAELRKETSKGFDDLSRKMDCYVPKIQYEADMRSVYEKLTKTSGNWDWIVKTVMGLVIGALITKLLMG
jgi:3-methyladenine DNA glycosylase AlkD